MRFRSSSPPRWVNRRDQARLLALVAVFAAVLLALNTAARPRTWAWLFGGEPAREPARDRPTARDVDFSVRFDDEAPLDEDEFRSPAPAPRTGHAGRRAGQPATPAGANPPAADEAASAAADDVRIAPEILRDVRDDYVGLRAGEADAYFHVLAGARHLDQAAVRRARAGHVEFAVLMDDPDRFRGRLVTVAGEIKGLTPIPLQPNEHGIEAVYEAWLFNSESWPNPWCIRCLEIPEGIPQGSRLTQPVRARVTGYFFKKYGYASEGGFHKAPLLLARRLEWLPAPAPTADRLPGLGPFLLGLMLLMAVGLGVMVWRFRAGDRRFAETHLRRLSAAPRESIEALSGLPTTDVSEDLRRLAEEESSARVQPADTKDAGHAAPGG